jgi:hypothetical protein
MGERHFYTEIFSFGQIGYQAGGLQKIKQMSKNRKNKVQTC